MSIRTVLWVGTFAILFGVCAESAIAHGGRYRGPSSLLPPGLAPTTPKGVPGGPTTPSGGGQDRWEFWWVHNFDTVSRLRDRAGQWHDAQQGQRAYEKITDDLREEVRRELLELLGDSSNEVVSAAALALGKIGLPESKDALLPLLSSGSQDVRVSAILALGLLGDEVGFDPIVQVLRSKRATQDLVAFGHLALGLIGSDAALKVLEAHTSKLLADASGSRLAPTRHSAVLAPTLLAFGLSGRKTAIPALQEVLLGDTSLDADVRSAAASALGKIPDPTSVAILARALEDKDIEVRRGAALALGEIIGPDDAEAERRLKILARGDSDPQVKSFALISLGKSQSPTARAFLESSFKERGQHTVRAFAALGLGLMGDRASAPLLHAALGKDKESSLVGAITLAIGLLGDSTAAPKLIELANGSGDPTVRSNALLALGLLGDPAVLPRIQGLLTPDLQAEMLSSLLVTFGLLGDRANLDRAEILLKRSRSETVKAAAAFALGRIGDAASAKLLVTIAMAKSESDTTRTQAVIALGNLLEDRAISRLSEISAGVNYRSKTLYLTEILDLL